MSDINERTTITGAQFREFYLNHFPLGYSHEDAGFEFEDEEANFTLRDDAVVNLGDCGYMVWPAYKGAAPGGRDTVPFVEFYREYAQTRTTTLVVVEVPLDRQDEILQYLEDAGCKVTVGNDGRLSADITATMKP